LAVKHTKGSVRGWRFQRPPVPVPGSGLAWRRSEARRGPGSEPQGCAAGEPRPPGPPACLVAAPLTPLTPQLNPAISGSSFSGRSLLRRGSMVVPTLTPIAGSEGASRDEDEDGSPPQGCVAGGRVGGCRGRCTWPGEPRVCMSTRAGHGLCVGDAGARARTPVLALIACVTSAAS
jgi:hypothetical protein